MNTPNSFLAAIGAVVLIAGVVLLGSSIRARRQRMHAIRDWPQVTATVISDDVADVGTTSAQVRFTTREGEHIVARVESAVSLGDDATGRSVRAWYNPASPTQVYADVHPGDRSAYGSIATSVVAIAMGALFVWIGTRAG